VSRGQASDDAPPTFRHVGGTDHECSIDSRIKVLLSGQPSIDVKPPPTWRALRKSWRRRRQRAVCHPFIPRRRRYAEFGSTLFARHVRSRPRRQFEVAFSCCHEASPSPLSQKLLCSRPHLSVIHRGCAAQAITPRPARQPESAPGRISQLSFDPFDIDNRQKLVATMCRKERLTPAIGRICAQPFLQPARALA
jgi:hypothetical protein